MTDLSVFKQLLSLDQVEDDLTAHLQLWLPRLLSEVAAQQNIPRGSFPVPKYWATTPVLTKESIAQVRYPAVLVVSGGTASVPVKRGDGTYEGTYSFGIATLTSGSDEMNSSKMARRYGRAVVATIMQRPGFADYIAGVNWIDERFTDYLGSEEEALSSATEIFNVTVSGLFNSNAGPADPTPIPDPTTPYPDNLTVRDPDSAPPYWPVDKTTKLR